VGIKFLFGFFLGGFSSCYHQYRPDTKSLNHNSPNAKDNVKKKRKIGKENQITKKQISPTTKVQQRFGDDKYIALQNGIY